MSYSFFGTCFNDHKQFFDCLNSILNQTISPKEIILINSGEENIEEVIQDKILYKKIKLVYIHKKLSRVGALNLAIDKSTSEFSLRFDSRSRFSRDYAEEALKVLRDKNLNVAVVGGVPSVTSISKKFTSIICSEIMERSYLYFFPKHRNKNFSGYSSSIYLGCFRTSTLREIKFSEKKDLISEDSLIINNFLENGFKAYISSRIKLSYVSRSSFLNILKLFNTYGYCRANTILLSRKLFISKRHLYVFISFVIIFLILFQLSLKSLIFLPLLLIVFNFLSELIFYRKKLNLFVSIYGTLCQFSWMVGFLWCLLTIFKPNVSKTNFIS